MSATFKYSLTNPQRTSEVLSLIDDLLFQKRAEMQEYPQMAESVVIFEQQIRVIKNRLFEFEKFSEIYLHEDVLSFEESLLLLLGLNPDVLANKYFHKFDLLSYSIENYLAAFLRTRTYEGKALYKSSVFENVNVNTTKFKEWAINKHYFTRILVQPKSANHRAVVKKRNLEITLEGLTTALKGRTSKTPASNAQISTDVHKLIKSKLIPINQNGDKPKPDTLRRYIGEIINSTDWKLQPESIRNKIK